MIGAGTSGGRGRPLRFLAGVGAGWIGLRILLVWQATGSLPQAVRSVVPVPGELIATVAPDAADRPILAPTDPIVADIPVRPPQSAAPATLRARAAADPIRVQLALLALTRYGAPVADVPPSPAMGPTQSGTAAPGMLARDVVSRGASPLSVSAWMIARGGTGLGASTLSPQLGGTQGGVRVDYAIGSGFAATGRLAAPAAGAGREASLGIAWRPGGTPVRIVAEHRFALDGGRSGPALGISGGVSQVALPAGFRLEGYGQAGAILRDGVERYVDGSLRAARPLADVGGVSLDAGGGAWGGAQRGVARLDLGPSVGVGVPLAGRRVRVSLDWRQRVAGNARPGSGPALTLGTDF